MPNGILLNYNDHEAQQPYFAVQRLSDDSSFYLFSIANTSSDTNGLLYSIIDMRLDGGLGDIVPTQKNIPVPVRDLQEGR